MSSADLKMAFEDALIEEMRNYRRDLCIERFGRGYNKLDHYQQQIVDEDVGKTFAAAVRKIVNAHLDL